MQRVVASAGGRGRRRGGPGMGGDPQARPRLKGWSSAAAQRTQRVVSPRRKDGRPRWGNQPAGASAEGGASPLGESAHRLLGGRRVRPVAWLLFPRRPSCCCVRGPSAPCLVCAGFHEMGIESTSSPPLSSFSFLLYFNLLSPHNISSDSFCISSLQAAGWEARWLVATRAFS